VPVRCLIVDDNVQFLEAARRLLERDGLTVVGVASTILEALEQAAAIQPDIVLVDIELGDEDGFDLARRLAEPADGPAYRVILVSTYDEADFQDLIAASPAIGFLSKQGLTARAVQDIANRA
jgi:DNA-binding NarL/FixJ family response regulator